MTEKLRNLFNKRNKLKEEQFILSEEREDFNNLSKKFNKNFLKVLLASIVLMIPMALYTIPVIPTTYVLAGETMKGFSPILPKFIPLDLLMYPAFLGGLGFLASTTALTFGNILYFLPLKAFGKALNNKISTDKNIINNTIIKENNNNMRTNRTNLYSQTKTVPRYEGYNLNSRTSRPIRRNDSYSINSKVQRRVSRNIDYNSNIRELNPVQKEQRYVRYNPINNTPTETNKYSYTYNNRQSEPTQPSYLRKVKRRKK